MSAHPIENQSSRRKAKTHPLQKRQRVRHPQLQLLSTKGDCEFKSGVRGWPPAPIPESRKTHAPQTGAMGHPDLSSCWSRMID